MVPSIHERQRIKMEKIRPIFSSEHRHCDELFSVVETHVQKCDWHKAQTSLDEFVQEMERHFGKEEEVLFPALEERTGQTMGPTQVMRMEHGSMRQLFKDMQNAVTTQNSGQFLGLSETLLIMMQQHNYKEENILYPMADNVLADDVADILARTHSG